MLKAHFVWWKLLTAMLVEIALLAIPVARATLVQPRSAGAVGTGMFLLAAVATALGVVSSNPKTFVIVLLMYLYVVVSDGGASAAFDFAGFYGKATPVITLTYGAVALGCLIAAQVAYAIRLRYA